MDIDETIRRIVREELRAAIEPLIESLESGGRTSKRTTSRYPAGDFLTVAEAAEITHRHPESIYLALQSKELRGAQRTKRGRWLIRDVDLESWASSTYIYPRETSALSVRGSRPRP